MNAAPPAGARGSQRSGQARGCTFSRSSALVDDAKLMSRLRADDAEALTELVARYWRPLVAHARDSVRDDEAAADIAQDAFVSLWRRRRLWDPRGSVRVWLFRTVRNGAISEHRKRAVRARWAAAHEGSATLARTPLHDAEDEELRRAVADALTRLPARRREAFTLFYLRDLSYREVAEVMDIREQSVANHLQAALADLRAELGRFFPALVPDNAPTEPPADADEPAPEAGER